MKKKKEHLLAGTFAIFFLMFHYPVLEAFNSSELLMGIPAVLFYFSLAWCLMIILMWKIMSR